MLLHRCIRPLARALIVFSAFPVLALAACGSSLSDQDVDTAIRNKCAQAAACDVLGPGEDEDTCAETRREFYDALDRDCRPAQVRLWRCLADLPCETLAGRPVTDTPCVGAYNDVVEAGCIPDVCLPTAP